MGRCRRAAAASAADVGDVGEVVDVGDVGESCGCESAPVLTAPAGFVSSTGDAMLSVMMVLLLAG
jgi:hypothetical protein